MCDSRAPDPGLMWQGPAPRKGGGSESTKAETHPYAKSRWGFEPVLPDDLPETSRIRSFVRALKPCGSMHWRAFARHAETMICDAHLNSPRSRPYRRGGLGLGFESCSGAVPGRSQPNAYAAASPTMPGQGGG